MKKHVILIAMLGGIAGKGMAQISIEGTIKNYQHQVIGITHTMIDMSGEKDTLQISKAGTFTYNSDLKAVDWGLTIDGKPMPLYTTPNDRIKIDLDLKNDKDWQLSFKGDHATENNYLAAFYELCSMEDWLKRTGYVPFNVYKAKNDKLDIQARQRLKAISDVSLQQKWSKRQDAALVYLTVRYYGALPAADKPKALKDAGFAAFVKGININDPQKVDYNVLSEIISWKVDNIPGLSTQEKAVQYLDVLQETVKDPKLMNDHATRYMRFKLAGSKTMDVKDVYGKYKTVCTDTAALRQLADRYEVYMNFFKVKPGSMAPDFEMTDPAGKKIHLSDLRGKMVYIDVWATWCHPCVGEIPHLDTLHQQFANDNRIEIISISIDERLDKWKEKIKKDQPAWKQYVVAGGTSSQLYKLYSIEYIPRFILIDKHGKIVNVNYMRPSDPGSAANLKARLDESI